MEGFRSLIPSLTRKLYEFQTKLPHTQELFLMKLETAWRAGSIVTSSVHSRSLQRYYVI